MYKKILNCNYDFVSPWWDEVSLNAKDLVSTKTKYLCRKLMTNNLQHSSWCIYYIYYYTLFFKMISDTNIYVKWQKPDCNRWREFFKIEIFRISWTENPQRKMELMNPADFIFTIKIVLHPLRNFFMTCKSLFCRLESWSFWTLRSV